MLENTILELRKGMRRFMNEKIRAWKEVLSSEHNRLIIGLITFGLGIGLIASAYLRV